MAIILGRDDEIVLFINSITREEFRKKFLFNIARIDEFASAFDEVHTKTEDLDSLRDMFISAGVPRELLMTYAQVREAAQAVSNRIMESLRP